MAAGALSLAALRWLAIEALPDDTMERWRESAVTGETLAFLQYTSGSTAAPKGVMLSHHNLLHNLDLVYRRFGHTPRSHVVSWLPPYHDMGLIGALLQPLYGGFSATLLAPAAFLRSPYRWLDTISRAEGVVTSGAPNFAYDLCVRTITPEQRATLDLSRWAVAFNGAEPIRSETLERFVDTFAPHGFRCEALYPTYGLAEATLMVSGGSPAAAPVVRRYDAKPLGRGRVVAASPEDTRARALVGCGAAPLDRSIVIVDPTTSTECTPGHVGEIWLTGPSVAQGYWRRPDETDAIFRAYLKDGGEGPFLRTGDLGFVDDSELFVTGRLDDLVVIRGRNHYPQDIELTVERCHAALRPGHGAAFTVSTDGEERLVVVQELERADRRANVAALARAIRAAVAEQHGVRVGVVVLARPGGVPMTSSGKVRRRACRQAYLDGRLPVAGVDSQDEPYVPGPAAELSRAALLALPPGQRPARLEAYLREMVARLANVAVHLVDLRTPLVEFGLDSLRMAEAKVAMDESLGVDMLVRDLVDGATVTTLAATIARRLAGIEERPRSPLTVIRASGTETPFFYLPGGLTYYRLMERLGADRPLYVLQPYEPDDLHALLTVEAMAAMYLREIQAIQPEGPYLLGGYCNGGFIAYEMAARLRARGHAVDLLALVDTPAVNLDAAAESGDARAAWIDAERQERQEMREGQESGAAEAYRLKWRERYARAVRSYIPRPYQGRVTLIQPHQGLALAVHARSGHAPPSGWARVAAEVTLYNVPGTHVSCLREHAHVLAACLQACLVKARRERGGIG